MLLRRESASDLKAQRSENEGSWRADYCILWDYVGLRTGDFPVGCLAPG
jgi:hypothetical protein